MSQATDLVINIKVVGVGSKLGLFILGIVARIFHIALDVQIVS